MRRARTPSLFLSKECDAMAEAFEREGRSLFGDGGFERTVARVSNLGIRDLVQFTPSAAALSPPENLVEPGGVEPPTS